MILSKNQEKEFENLTRPVIEWMNNNCHPHISMTICCTRAELSEGIAGFTTFDYLKDIENKCGNGTKIPDGGCFGCEEGDLCA